MIPLPKDWFAASRVLCRMKQLGSEPCCADAGGGPSQLQVSPRVAAVFTHCAPNFTGY